VFIYSIRNHDVCGRWSVVFTQAASQSDAEAIASWARFRSGSFYVTQTSRIVLPVAARVVSNGN
jgi:hypothetical protein